MNNTAVQQMLSAKFGPQDEAQAYIAGIVESSHGHYYDSANLLAAVIPETNFFNQGRVQAPGVCNMDKTGEFLYDFYVMGVAVEFFQVMATATIADTDIFREETEFFIKSVSKEKPSWPMSFMPGGSGLKIAGHDAAAGIGAMQLGGNGISNNFLVYTQPFMILKGETFQATLRSAAVTALTNIATVRVHLLGIEARRAV